MQRTPEYHGQETKRDTIYGVLLYIGVGLLGLLIVSAFPFIGVLYFIAITVGLIFMMRTKAS